MCAWQPVLTGNKDIQEETATVEQLLGEAGRVLIRPSGTEPLIRVMVEAKNAETAQTMAQRIADKVIPR
jgi:phosphoglucosamine mutase